jgi:hypothetical protein
VVSFTADDGFTVTGGLFFCIPELNRSVLWLRKLVKFFYRLAMLRKGERSFGKAWKRTRSQPVSVSHSSLSKMTG